MDAVNAAKRLWLESLSHFTPETVRQAIHALIKQSDYLPTISRIIKQCITLSSKHELPDTHSAYIEACRAPSPKQNYLWSHPAVYYAGKHSDWYFLASNSEALTFPVFKKQYEKICERLITGETLAPIEQLALPETSAVPLSKQDNAERMAELRSELDI